MVIEKKSHENERNARHKLYSEPELDGMRITPLPSLRGILSSIKAPSIASLTQTNVSVLVLFGEETEIVGHNKCYHPTWEDTVSVHIRGCMKRNRLEQNLRMGCNPHIVRPKASVEPRNAFLLGYFGEAVDHAIVG